MSEDSDVLSGFEFDGDAPSQCSAPVEIVPKKRGRGAPKGQRQKRIAFEFTDLLETVQNKQQERRRRRNLLFCMVKKVKVTQSNTMFIHPCH